MMRQVVPEQLPLDTFDGQCWIGVVPFWMSGVRARALPPVPGLSRFPELNVRTYVTYGGKPGVYFFSLDITSHLALWSARTFYHLPYFHASMNAVEHNGSIRYSSARGQNPAEFRASYRPTAPVCVRKKGSLEDWLTSRYCLYTLHKSRVYRCDIHHLPWPLQEAEAELGHNTMGSAAGIYLPASGPLLHFSRQLDVLIWPLRRVEE